jgi:hypothetical protein
MTDAGPRVAVEPLEGRKLFAATVNAAADTGAPDIAPAELVFAREGLASASPWSASDLPALETAGPKLSLSCDEAAFDEPAGGGIGAIHTLSIRNAGIGALTIPSGGLSIVGKHAELFQILVAPELPITIAPGASLDVPLTFNPGSSEILGEKSAALCIRSNDPAAPEVSVALRGSFAGAWRDPAVWRILHF